MTEPHRATHCRRGATLLALAAFVLLGALLYGKTLDVPFYFDDIRNIRDNVGIRLTSLSPLALFKAGFNSTISTRPVANISFALNYYFHRDHVAGYHLVNIAIHICTGLLLFLVLKATLSLPACDRDRHHADGLAFMVALLWFVHPVQTQSVTYIVQRMNSMAAMFYLLALLLYIRGRLAVAVHRQILFYGFGLFAAAMAFGSKELAVTLPGVIVLYEWFFFRNLTTLWLKQRLPAVLLSLALFFAAGVLITGLAPVERILSGYGDRDFSPLERLLTQPRVIIQYLTLLTYPHPDRLTFDYAFPLSRSLLVPASTLPALVYVAGLFGLAVVLARRQRLISFCLLWFLGNLVLESSIIPLEIIYEHRLYLPGMMVFVPPLLLLSRIKSRQRVAMAVVVGIVVLFGYWTMERNRVWLDPVDFWQDSVNKSPTKARPHQNLGYILAERGQQQEAMSHLRTALEIDPQNGKAHSNLATVLHQQGRYRDAITHYRLAVAAEPNDPYTHNNLGVSYQEIGELGQAVAMYASAVRINPSFAEAHNNLGLVLSLLGRLDDAVASLQEAVRLEPDLLAARQNLGLNLIQLGRPAEAIEHLQVALKLKPDYAEAHNNLGVAMLQTGRTDEALNHFASATRLAPGDEQYQHNLAFARQQLQEEETAENN